MKLSWNSLKISIAGAKLTHLVQKDKIWDHGSMTEQAKNIFYQVEKAINKKDAEHVKKYLTNVAFEQLGKLIKRSSVTERPSGNSILTEVLITEVKQRNNKKPDRFKALLKGKRKVGEEILLFRDSISKQEHGIQNFSVQWIFCREGDWWLLDHI
jgi:hypothetical protein